MGPRKRPLRYSGSERRVDKRWPFWAMVAAHEISEEEFQSSSGLPNEGFASCVNISDRGMLLESFDRYQEGTLLSLAIQLPGEEEPDASRFVGKVVHTSRVDRSSMNGLGIYFLDRPKKLDVWLQQAKNDSGHPFN